MRTLLIACALFLAAAAPAGVLPGLPPDATGRRVRVDGAAMPWQALVRVQAPGLSRCTGFLLAPDLVVTAAHCLFAARLGGMIPPGSVHVLSGYGGGAYTGHAVVASYALGEAHDPARAPGSGRDFAVLRLATKLPGGVLELGEVGGEAAMLGGFNQDRAEVIEADPRCRVLGQGRDAAGLAVLVHDCAATSGTSGAPLLGRGRDGAWRAVGVQVAARRGAAGGVAAPASAVRRLLGADAPR